jgi:hypothetical protein
MIHLASVSFHAMFDHGSRGKFTKMSPKLLTGE